MLSPKVDPSQEYKRRLEDRKETVEHYRKLDLLIGNLRLARGHRLLCGAVVESPASIFSPGWWILRPVVVFAALVVRHEQVRALGRRTQRALAFYERGLARIEDRWIGTGDPGRAFFDEAHPYVVDLDIFGKGSLFELLSRLARVPARRLSQGGCRRRIGTRDCRTPAGDR